MCRVRDCFILMTLAGLAFGLATKAVSQGDTQRSQGEWRQFNGGYDATRFSRLHGREGAAVVPCGAFAREKLCVWPASSANVWRTTMSRVPDCFIIMTLAGLTFGLATKAVSQGGTQKSHGEWPQFNGGYDATRFSTLTQIDTNNVGSLREVARFKIPETTSFQADPVVVGGTMSSAWAG